MAHSGYLRSRCVEQGGFASLLELALPSCANCMTILLVNTWIPILNSHLLSPPFSGAHALCHPIRSGMCLEPLPVSSCRHRQGQGCVVAERLECNCQKLVSLKFTQTGMKWNATHNALLLYLNLLHNYAYLRLCSENTCSKTCRCILKVRVWSLEEKYGARR